MSSTTGRTARKYIGLKHETGDDSKIRFTIEPLPGDDAFDQWRDGMKAVAGLPMGIPADFRKKVWLSLADNYLNGLCIDWEKTKTLAFNRKSNPDDNKLGLQIVKDLHRTGSTMFSGEDSDEDRAMLERILLAYARWNKQVGYCQGFNVLAAMILDVMDRQEDCALKVMIFLIDRVLPEGYFANNLRALSVDMAVFRDLLRQHLPRFSRHLDWLQASAKDQTTGASYEPPLTNVFTMQWFLTLFATCLPKPTALRIWDAVLLEGSEILLRCAIAVWGLLQRRLCSVQSADEFYTTMGTLTQEMLSGSIVDEDAIIETVYAMGAFPMPGLTELRDKYKFIISPFAAAISARQRSLPSSTQQDGGDALDEMIDVTCFAGMFPPSPQRDSSNGDLSLGTGTSSNLAESSSTKLAASMLAMQSPLERMARDVDMLDRQYHCLKERQKQAHIILAGARQQSVNNVHEAMSVGGATIDNQSVAVNHLFVGRDMLGVNNRNRRSSKGCKSHSLSPSAGRSSTTTSNNEQTQELRLCVGEQCRDNNRAADDTRPGTDLNEVSVSSRQLSHNGSEQDALCTAATLKGSSSTPALLENTPVLRTSNRPPEPEQNDGGSVDSERPCLNNPTMLEDACTRRSSEETAAVCDEPQPASASCESPPRQPAQKSCSVDDFQSIAAQSQAPRVQPVQVVDRPNSCGLAKVFNPFPKQYVNKRRTQNGIRLGLYTAAESASVELARQS